MIRRSKIRLLLAGVLLTCVAVAQPVAAADLYDAAVANPARSAADRKRDVLEHPAEMLRLAGIEPGMRVADLLAGAGYYSELASHVVGPKGHVLMLNNAAYHGWSDGARQKRLDANRLPNVEYRVIDLNRMDLGAGTLDAALLIKVYHDLYWIDPRGDWPKIDVRSTLDQVAKALKPGGVVLLVDHSAKPGTQAADASALHRIDEAFARKDFESRGLEVVATSEVFRNSADERNLLTYEGPGVGKSDRFVLVFRKKAS